MKNIPKIVLTGGPSGGKTTALKQLKIKLEALGINVYAVCEAASGLINDGLNNAKRGLEFQKAVALRQIESEQKAAAKTESHNSVIICDRGLMDARVYLDNEEFNTFKAELNMNEIDLRDRYDAVFHLETTACSDKIEYIADNVRTENRSEAQRINELSLKAWCGNPHYRFIPVCDTFDEKLEILFKEVKAFLGIPKPLEIERKYLIKYPDIEFLKSLVCVKSEIEQTYLSDEQGRFRLRKRGENGNYIYIKTVKRKISETIREEVETLLTKNEYEALLNSGKILGTISKDRYCLMYGGTYYEIDIFPFWKKQAYLEVELLREDDKISIPEFIEVIREVTYDSRYKNSSLCKNIPFED